MRRIALIAAMGRNRVIGAGNAMPWHLPADLKRFKTITLGKPVIMGRLTFESIGKPLPGRDNIVISRNPTFSAPGCSVRRSLDEALDKAGDHDEIMVIGGAQIYALALPRANYMHLTCVDADFEGDTWFPKWEASRWREVWREPHVADTQNPYAYTFVNLARLAPRPAR